MATARETLATFAAGIDAETNRIAAELLSKVDALANAATPEAVTEILQPSLDKLKSTGTVVPPIEEPPPAGRRG